MSCEAASILSFMRSVCPRRRAILKGSARVALIAMLPWPAAARAQAADRTIAFVDIDRPGARESFERMRRALAARRLPGRFGVELRFVATDQTDAAALAALPGVLASLAPAAVIATSVPTAKVVASTGIPAVFFGRGDPVQQGLVRSRQKPGGSMTGYSAMPPPVEKMLELIADAFPASREIGVLADAQFFEIFPDLAPLEAAARALGQRMRWLRLDALGDIERAAHAMKRCDALAVTYCAVAFLHSEALARAINTLRIPAVYASTRNVRDGGLLGFEPDVRDAADSFARQLEAILSGVPAGDIPVERPRLYRLSLNAATARATGIRIAPSVVKRADLVVA